MQDEIVYMFDLVRMLVKKYNIQGIIIYTVIAIGNYTKFEKEVTHLVTCDAMRYNSRSEHVKLLVPVESYTEELFKLIEKYWNGAKITAAAKFPKDPILGLNERYAYYEGGYIYFDMRTNIAKREATWQQ